MHISVTFRQFNGIDIYPEVPNEITIGCQINFRRHSNGIKTGMSFPFSFYTFKGEHENLKVTNNLRNESI